MALKVECSRPRTRSQSCGNCAASGARQQSSRVRECASNRRLTFTTTGIQTAFGAWSAQRSFQSSRRTCGEISGKHRRLRPATCGRSGSRCRPSCRRLPPPTRDTSGLGTPSPLRLCPLTLNATRLSPRRHRSMQCLQRWDRTRPD